MIKAQKPSFLLLFAIFGCILLAGAQFLRESQSAEFSGRRPDRLKTYGYSRDCRRLGTPDSDRFIEVCRQGLGDGVALEIRYLGELSRQRKWPLPISAMLRLNGREGLFQMASIQDSFLGSIAKIRISSLDPQATALFLKTRNGDSFASWDLALSFVNLDNQWDRSAGRGYEFSFSPIAGS